jgi:hypothetical protein
VTGAWCFLLVHFWSRNKHTPKPELIRTVKVERAEKHAEKNAKSNQQARGIARSPMKLWLRLGQRMSYVNHTDVDSGFSAPDGLTSPRSLRKSRTTDC